MPRIQITNEISTQLSSLKNAVNASVDFGKAQQLTFSDSDFSSATALSNAVSQYGSLAQSYQATLTRDVESCKQIVENALARDQQLGSTMFAAV